MNSRMAIPCWIIGLSRRKIMKKALKFFVCVAVALSLFHLWDGRALSGDSTNVIKDITGYTGKESTQSGGGSYLQEACVGAYGETQRNCLRPNAFTGACSCPAGYSPQLVSAGEITTPYADGFPPRYYGFHCEK